MLVAPPSKDYSQTVMWPVKPDFMPRLEAALQTIQEQAASDMAAEHYPSDQLAWHRTLDMRYRGQSHELTIPLPKDNSAERLARDFDEAHLRRFGYCQPAAAREIVTLRLAVTAPVAPVNWSAPIADTTGSAQVGRKPIWFSASGPTDTALYRREGLASETSFHGPALVLQYDTTTVIPPGWSARVDRWGNILLDSS
jgi:N-methylhydantoinase A